MPEWIARPSSAKGRLALTALEEFGRRGYDGVNVVELARTAGVTTGVLYHHFGNKAGLHRVVMAEARQRVIDRMEGAAAARAGDSPADAARAGLLVAFDYCVAAGFTGLLAETGPEADADPIEALLARVSNAGELPVGRLLAAAWRAALRAVADGVPVDAARRALAALSVSP
jgi:AcrR family transcriptional regulator